MTETGHEFRAGGATRVAVALGIIAWNEEAAIGPMLESVFAQTLFAELAARDERAQILCVTNGCTDGTPGVAARIFEAQSRSHQNRAGFSARVVDLKERGKINAWNEFVHRLSSPEANYLILLDADILLQGARTLSSLVRTLEEHSTAVVATDRPLKDVALKKRKGWRERGSVAASRLTQSEKAQLTGQLYCIRAEAARRIYLPRDLPACEDGFIKWIVCTDFLTSQFNPEAIVVASEAAHIFEAYTRWTDLLRNQKRQMIGQTVVHLLIDRELPKLSAPEKLRLADTLREREAADRDWLKRLVGAHLRTIGPRFWRLFPGMPSHRFRNLSRLTWAEWCRRLPVALAGWAVMMLACWQAHRFFRRGYTAYWPDTQSPRLKDFSNRSCAAQMNSRLGEPAVSNQG